MVNIWSSPDEVYLPQALAQEIIAHSLEGFPEEVCGVIRGLGPRAHEVVRGRNIAEKRRVNYTVDPQTLLLQFEFEDSGAEMMGIYHSHPESEAYPSATDAWNAHYPDAYYFICSLEDPRAPEIRAYRMHTKFLDHGASSLATALQHSEVRPGLFGRYEANRQDAPSELVSYVKDILFPLYIVHNLSSESEIGGGPITVDIRIVSTVEHAVVIE